MNRFLTDKGLLKMGSDAWHRRPLATVRLARKLADERGQAFDLRAVYEFFDGGGTLEHLSGFLDAQGARRA